MELSQLMSWIGFVTGMLIGTPQIVKTIKTKSARDLSTATFCLILITCICFFARVIVIKEIALIFYYFFYDLLLFAATFPDMEIQRSEYTGR